jgi:hypothetical protein
MSYIKLLSELVAWRNFTLKEESPDRIVFELWDKANWERIAKGINRDNLVNSSIFIALIFGGSLFVALILSKPWGNLSFLISAVITILFIVYKVKLYQKTKFASSPCAVFDRSTGLANGVNIDLSTFESTPWQIEIAQIYSLALKWDDPRFDMAMLEALDSNSLILCVVFGRSNDLRKNAEILKKWLKVALQDEIKS